MREFTRNSHGADDPRYKAWQHGWHDGQIGAVRLRAIETMTLRQAVLS